ncbi:MAG: SBBP repeat-containing protein, partial [Bacteroidia bacterium]|nr:SBBP repeat-containing protein [Bacteroidia bacterium]
LKGMADAFVAKFGANGQRIWGSYWGGEDYDYGNALVRMADGSMGICGGTFSSTGIATNGVHDTIYSSGMFYGDGFVAKIGSNGQKIWGSYYGGTGGDNALAILADSAQNLVVAGFSMSGTGLASAGAHQVNFGGDYDGFLAKFNSLGQLLWGTYYGGIGVDYLNSICFDKQKNIVFGGRSTSDSMVSFGTVHQLTYGGGMSWGDGILGKFNGNGVRLWSTYFGGSGEETIQGISIDTNNAIYIGGSTTGSLGFSTVGTHQSNYGGGSSDGFFAKFGANGNRIWCSYLGGNNVDGVNGIQAFEQGSGVIVGFSSSSGLATFGAQQTLLSGAPDMILGHFDENGLLPVTFLFVNANFTLNGLECKWATTSETNNNKFEVERSGNGVLFEKIGEVNGTKNSLKTTHYSFMDLYPLMGSNYYRIKQIDLDGQFSYSKIVEALNEQNLQATQCLIKPNPTNGIIYVLPTANSGIQNKKILKILDSNGLEVYTEELTLYNGTWNSINLQNLKSGLYILILNNEARKIVIEK